MEMKNNYKYGLFYPLPFCELMFSQRVEQNLPKGVKPLINGLCERPYNQVSILLGFLFFTIRFNIKF